MLDLPQNPHEMPVCTGSEGCWLPCSDLVVPGNLGCDHGPNAEPVDLNAGGAVTPVLVHPPGVNAEVDIVGLPLNAVPLFPIPLKADGVGSGFMLELKTEY